MDDSVKELKGASKVEANQQGDEGKSLEALGVENRRKSAPILNSWLEAFIDDDSGVLIDEERSDITVESMSHTSVENEDNKIKSDRCKR